MKRIVVLWCFMIAAAAILAGCFDQTKIEDVTLALIVGIDVDDKNRTVVYESSPVFHKEAKDKEEKYGVHAITLRRSRDKFDLMAMGLATGSKTRAILVSKKVMEQPDWSNYLDLYMRDAKNTVTSYLIAVDGSVSDIVFFSPKDKPRLPLYLVKLIRTASMRNLTVNTTLRDFHRQMLEPGLTPYVAELKKDGKIKITGTALLDEQGRYKLSLDERENRLLRILQNHKDGDYSFTLSMPEAAAKKGKMDKLSVTGHRIKTKTKVKHEDKFIFDIDVKMSVIISERLFPANVRSNAAALEKEMNKQLEARFAKLVGKIQKARIDPIGLGLYARAYAYPEWKKVQNRWGDVLSEAEIRVKVKTRIAGMGTIK
ncbi:Ger(x)C family spore germination protein [Paenibacillus ginsengarvi]|uniref:Ger(X)C family spore germination protein n=1 Tax=Paenibacillus ginsengarvi TaxID=400777 RepID=A0A3B0AV57_9BACL|nr:Ger(x)C family spore germination protein [Paenibacillus ginsengarvi]RKN64875.1 Ger(x)C family spore germination protein [Paenibacillus ginsengarvi]